VTQSEIETVRGVPGKYSEGKTKTRPLFGGAPVLKVMLFLIAILPIALGLIAAATTYSVFSAQLPQST